MGMDQRFGRGVALSIPRGRVPVWTIAVAMVAGLLLAIPLTAGIKAVCDNVKGLRPYGKFLGD